MDPDTLTNFVQDRMGYDIKALNGSQVEELLSLLKEELDKKVA